MLDLLAAFVLGGGYEVRHPDDGGGGGGGVVVGGQRAVPPLPLPLLVPSMPTQYYRVHMLTTVLASDGSLVLQLNRSTILQYADTMEIFIACSQKRAHYKMHEAYYLMHEAVYTLCLSSNN